MILSWNQVEQWRLSLPARPSRGRLPTRKSDCPAGLRTGKCLSHQVPLIQDDKGMTHDRCAMASATSCPASVPVGLRHDQRVHLYGFPSADSDYDLRGVHLLPLAEAVGLQVGHETVEKTGVYDGLEVDLVTTTPASSSLCCCGRTAMCWSSCCRRWWSTPRWSMRN